MNFPVHIVNLLKKLYDQQEACVRTAYGNIEWFRILKAVRQGCGLSPPLLNLYTEVIMRKVLENYTHGISVGGQTIRDLRYADDVVMLAENIDDLQVLLSRVDMLSGEMGLILHPGKTKAMKVDRDGLVDADVLLIGNSKIDFVDNFVYLGSRIDNDQDDTQEIKRRIAVAKSACIALANIWKNRSIRKYLKLRLLDSLVFSIALYGAECWSMKQSDRKRLDSFYIWCSRRLLRVSWTEFKTNLWIIEKIGRPLTLLRRADELKLRYFGHIARKRGLENNIMTGAVYEKGSCETSFCCTTVYLLLYGLVGHIYEILFKF